MKINVVTGHTIHGVLLIEAMAAATKREDLLATYEPHHGEVDVVCKINGHEVDLIAALAHAWKQLTNEFDKRVEAAAAEKLTKMLADHADKLVDAHEAYTTSVKQILNVKATQ